MPLFDRAVIVGVGLIGGSLGMAMRQRGLAGEVIGVVRSEEAIPEAVARGAIDYGTVDLEVGVGGADVVVIATPPEAVAAVAARAAAFLREGAILTDVTSVKATIVHAVEACLPPRATGSFVGGHPMAGNEGRGVSSASPALFEGTAYLITPTPRTSPIAVERVADLARGVGATPVRMDPEEHDRAVAFVSHLPYLIAAALVSITTPSAAIAAGPAFLGATRVAGSPVELWGQICRLNRDQILRALHRFQAELSRLERALTDGDGLDAMLEQAREARMRLPLPGPSGAGPVL